MKKNNQVKVEKYLAQLSPTGQAILEILTSQRARLLLSRTTRTGKYYNQLTAATYYVTNLTFVSEFEQSIIKKILHSGD